MHLCISAHDVCACNVSVCVSVCVSADLCALSVAPCFTSALSHNVLSVCLCPDDSVFPADKGRKDSGNAMNAANATLPR